MNKILIVVSAMLLAGCTTTVPVKRTFPEAPPALLEPPAPLRTLEPNARLSRIVEASVENMGSYHVISEKYRAWQEWYNTQKRIFNEVNE